ncbi:protein of unknown function DUF192 [Methylobacterium sp. 4-46]|uniref:DUF192 domain-containing protein n=1 Tax=unclassified Methylobacterium TaxID=2615210 RepID=UPI000165C6CB|nr:MULTISPECIES: DUF192 domain-containing protein [Methylobacterium]ACA14952.1 protein of unknown function DUF192 [Methylobacterium sp. 4-46]WFT80690.1 DUF192 domain-containing protein [Methylobacterium nodulans]
MSLRFTRPHTAAALAALAFVLTLLAAPVRAEGPTEPLSIVSRSGRHAFQVEVMRDDAGRAQGLMFRRSMAPDHGMLFDFAQVAPVTMWMKNTYLPLDMLFIRADGTVSRIAADTEPLSTRVIPSGGPILAVLELNAGTAAKLGIRAGDKVEHPLFRGR